MESRAELSGIAQTLWDNDVNRLQPGIDYKISLQEQVGQTYTDVTSKTTFPLFLFVNEDVCKKKTFSAFISLLDNYEADRGHPEVITPEEENEIHSFLDALMETRVLQRDLDVWKFTRRTTKKINEALTQQDLSIGVEMSCFLLHRPNSSGFEHVFVGETRGGRTVIGFHNWIQFYLQEKLGHVDYRGYTMPNNQVEVSKPQSREGMKLTEGLRWG
ncbi:poly(U)-specific endoribonuclease-B-like [Amblyraja radiata]|uniref:poly(U)-specific endoribonuclease-B-like n=1 Tax=Amblyraja radiata TaxID=386614 RepID=UPI001403A75F|nr:poly(U)-specific endoribonuclease-B-like [Amblyraja radiata]